MMGKPIVQSREEVEYAIERTNILIDLADEALAPEVISKNGNITKTVIREPVSEKDFNVLQIGPVMILSSFDFPVLSIVNHLVPAILCGNSVLLKDNPRTPLSKYKNP